MNQRTRLKKQRRHSYVLKENDYYEIAFVCYMHTTRNYTMYMNWRKKVTHKAYRVDNETIYYLIDKDQGDAVVMKTKDGNLIHEVYDRRTQEKINRIDEILLEE